MFLPFLFICFGGSSSDKVFLLTFSVTLLDVPLSVSVSNCSLLLTFFTFDSFIFGNERCLFLPVLTGVVSHDIKYYKKNQ